MSTHDSVITDIITELNARLIAGGGTTTGDALIGHRARGDNARPPRITWDDSDTGGKLSKVAAAGGGSSGASAGNKTAGNPQHLLRDTRTFEVSIWHTTRDNALATLHNLVASTHFKGYSSNVVDWTGDYSISADGASRNGVLITTRVAITIIATKDIWVLVADPEIDSAGVIIEGTAPYEQYEDA